MATNNKSTEKLKPGKDYKYQFICKKKGIIKTNNIGDDIGLILHDKDGEAAWQRFYQNGKLAYKSHYKDGKLHNLKEAAEIWYNKKGKIIKDKYWIEGNIYSRIEWWETIQPISDSDVQNMMPELLSKRNKTIYNDFGYKKNVSKKWEYKVETHDGLISQETLNEFGNKGWELINIHEDFTGIDACGRYMFKKEII